MGGQGGGPQRPPHQLGKHNPDVSSTQRDKQHIHVISNNCAFGSRSCTATSTDVKSYSPEQACAPSVFTFMTANGHTSTILELTELRSILHVYFVHFRTSALHETLQLCFNDSFRVLQQQQQQQFLSAYLKFQHLRPSFDGDNRSSVQYTPRNIRCPRD